MPVDQSTAITWNSTTLSPLGYADAGQTERTQAGSVNQYSSPLGLVIDKVGTSRTHYTRDNNGNLIGQRNPDGTRWYYMKDGLGSVVAVINEAGTTIGHRYGYDAWGKQTSQSGTVVNPWGYASDYLDTTGLIQFGTRYYDPNLGRWTQQDAVGGSIGSPASINRYIYVSCNPVNGTDPTGRFCARAFAASLALYFIAATLARGATASAVLGVLTLPELIGLVPIVMSLLRIYASFQIVQLAEGLYKQGVFGRC
jgi:RHS repeat-associated protein